MLDKNVENLLRQMIKYTCRSICDVVQRFMSFLKQCMNVIIF